MLGRTVNGRGLGAYSRFIESYITLICDLPVYVDLTL